MCGFDVWENHYCEVALEFLSGGLRIDSGGIGLDAVELFYGLGHGLRYYFVDRHSFRELYVMQL